MRALRFLRRVARGLLGLVVLVVAGLLFYLRDLDRKVRTALVEQAGELSAKIGRRVSVGEVHVAVGLSPEIVVHDLEIGPAEGALGELAVPVLRIPAVRLAVALGPLIRSRGAALEVTRFHVEGPEVIVVRSAQGLSTDDLRARLAAAPARRPVKLLLALRSLAITGGKLRLHELGHDAGGDVTLDRIALTGRDLTLGAPSHLSFAVAVLAPAPNVTAELDLAPAASGPGLQLARAEVHAGAVRLGPAVRWAGGASGDLDDAELDAAVTVEPGAAIAIKGKITLARVRLAAGAPSTTLALAAGATLDPAAGTLAVPSFDIGLGAVTAHGALSARDLEGTPTLDAVQLDASGDAAAIRALLPPGRLPPGLAVSGPVTLSLRGAGGADDAHVRVQLAAGDVRALALDRAGKISEGRPAGVSLEAALAFSRSARSLKVSDAAIHVGEVVVRGDAELRGLGAEPAIEALAIEASAPGEAVLDLVPPPRRPPGMTLRGPIVLRLSARGARDDLRATLALDGGAAAVHARGFAKPAGVPLGVTLEGRVADHDGGVVLDRAELRVGTLALSARGAIRDAEQLDLAFEPLAGPGADLDAMLQLFPEAAGRVGSGTRIGGRLAASGRVRRSGGKTTVDLTTRLREASFHHGLAALSGGVDASAHLEASAGAASVQTDVDLTGASLDVVPVIAKRAGRPSHLAFTVAREGAQVSVREARVALPGVTIEGITAEQGPARVHLAVGGATVALAPLVDMIPLLLGRLPAPLAGATLRFGLDLEGTPDALGAASLRIPSLDLTGGLGHVAGAVELDGLPPRALRFEVSRGDLDLSGFESPEGGGGAPFDAPAMRLEGRVHLDSARAGGETARALDAEVSFEHGRLAVGALHLSALGGTLVVEKSYLDLAGVPELELHARGEGIDLSRFAGPRAAELRGRATGAFDVHGQGADRAAMARSLRGSARLEVTDLHVKAVFPHPKITVVNPGFTGLLDKQAKTHAGEPRTLDLRAASADLEITAGKATTRSPILLRSDDFTVRVTGTLGEGAALALEGQVEIMPHVIAAASKYALVPLGPIPLKLKLWGDGGGRKLELLELRETAAAFRGSLRNAVDNAAMPVP